MSMCLVKRIIPFAATLTLGLFIASFFVTVAAPKLNFKRNYENRGSRKIRVLERDNQLLREQIKQQQSKIEELETRQTLFIENNFDGTQLPIAPVAPSVSRRVR